MPRSQVTLHNVPPQPTSFVGRISDISDIIDRLRDPNCRLLTLFGAGGIGKTRLAIEIIRHLTNSDFAHGVFYIPLAPLTSTDNIVTTTINTLGIMIGNEGDLQDELIRFLKQRDLLLVMDNFEHLLDGVTLVADILSTAPNVTILATSREILNLNMEYIWHVRGMAYPSTSDPEDINRFDALNLFIERAMQVRRDFSLGDEQISIIRICQLVDGLPLGIELAAGWLKTLSPSEIVRQIERGIDILATRTRNTPERHSSIRAVFDHSWQLLTPEEQDVFPRLSVFRGGFTLEAAEQVAGAGLINLSGLIEKSMIREDGNGRYDIHELLRQYGEENLEQALEIKQCQQAHMDYFASFMTERFIDIQGRDQANGLEAVAIDFDNVIEAWYQAIQHISYDTIEKMIDAIYYFSETRWLHPITYPLFEYAVNLLKSHNETNRHLVYNRLIMIYWASWNRLHGIAPPDEFWQEIECCYTVAQNANHDFSLMQCHYTRGLFYKVTYQKDQALDEFKQARRIAQTLNEPYIEVIILAEMNYLYSHFGGNQEISRTLRQLSKDIGAMYSYGLTYGYQSFHERGKFDLPAAEECIKTAIKYFRIAKDIRLVGAITFQRGYLWTVRGDFDLGEKYLIEGERITVQHNFPWNHSKLYTVRMLIALIRSNQDEAYQHKQSATEYFHRSSPDGIALYHMGQAIYEIAYQHYDICLPHLSEALSLDMPFTDHIKASALILSAFLYFDAGNNTEATELLGLAQGQLAKYTVWFNDWTLLHKLQDDLKADLGEDVYQSLWERGEQRDFHATREMVISRLKPDTTDLIEPLTDREQEVLVLLGEAYTNKQIGQALVVSVGTIKAHVHNICQKLGVNSRLQAVNEARKLNLL